MQLPSSSAASAPKRRALLRAALAAPLAAALPAARAGNQRYEPLADAVRVALAAQIADARPPLRSFDEPTAQVAFIEWMGTMSARLKARKPDDRLRYDFLRTLDYETARAGLDRQLVLALIEVESNFRKYAISSAGARGDMQVMPFWTNVIGDGDARKLFDLRANLRYGCVILRHYLDLEQGDLYLALGRYNGSRGRPEYPNAVNAAWQKRWKFEPRQATAAAG
ncbi:MAG: lytic transglycosylase domain-containing protein [Betaproteobacteria bacterium]